MKIKSLTRMSNRLTSIRNLRGFAPWREIGLCLLLFATGLQAQTTLSGDHIITGDLNVGTSGTTGNVVVTGEAGGSAGPSLVVTGDGGVVFSGSFGVGQIPASGAGERFMWYPGKGAFRAGGAYGSEWDDNNIGDYSVALGAGSKAAGENSIAMTGGESAGLRATAMSGGRAEGVASTAMSQGWAEGDGSTAMSQGVAKGTLSTAVSGGWSYSGAYSTSMSWATTSGDYSTAMSGGDASGSYATAMGGGFASGNNSTAMSGGSAGGNFSTAMSGGSASGNDSTAMGGGFAGGNGSVAMVGLAMGNNSIAMTGGYASGDNTTAMGEGAAYGKHSVASGPGINAFAAYSFVIGRNNVEDFSQNPEAWSESDSLFEVGNGTGNPSDPSEIKNRNAFTIYKNGKIKMDRQGDILMGEYGNPE